jgi:hypothetical protein
MDAFRKAAWLLIGFAGLAIYFAMPAAAENDRVQFYNSPAASAAKLPFSQAVRWRRAVHVRCHRHLAGQKGIGSRRD